MQKAETLHVTLGYLALRTRGLYMYVKVQQVNLLHPTPTLPTLHLEGKPSHQAKPKPAKGRAAYDVQTDA